MNKLITFCIPFGETSISQTFSNPEEGLLAQQGLGSLANLRSQRDAEPLHARPAHTRAYLVSRVVMRARQATTARQERRRRLRARRAHTVPQEMACLRPTALPAMPATTAPWARLTSWHASQARISLAQGRAAALNALRARTRMHPGKRVASRAKRAAIAQPERQRRLFVPPVSTITSLEARL